MEETIKAKEPHTDSDNEGKIRISVLPPPFFIYTVILHMQILSPTEVGEEEDFEPYISEDREVEAARNRKTAQCIQTAILQDLRQELGAAATLPENATKDLILQVIIIITFNPLPQSVIDFPMYIIYTLKPHSLTSFLTTEYCRG